MDELVIEFNKLVEEKNKEIENLILLKEQNRKMKENSKNVIESCELSQEDKDKQLKIEKEKIDYTTKKTLSKIVAEQDRKLKASKAYKKLQANSI